MNTVQLLGRIARDIDLRYSTSGTAVARFSVAVDRPTKDGQDRTADFPSVVAFGKTAETIDKYFAKGARIGLTGRLQTGSYQDKDGRTVYTTDVVVTGFDFCESRPQGVSKPTKPETEEQPRKDWNNDGVQETMQSHAFRRSQREKAAAAAFEELDEDVPW